MGERGWRGSSESTRFPTPGTVRSDDGETDKCHPWQIYLDILHTL